MYLNLENSNSHLRNSQDMKIVIYEDLNQASEELSFILEMCRYQLVNNDEKSAASLLRRLKKDVSNNISQTRKLISTLNREDLEYETSSNPPQNEHSLSQDENDDLEEQYINSVDEIIQDLHSEVLPKLAAIMLGLRLCERLMVIDSSKAVDALNQLRNVAVDVAKSAGDFGLDRRFQETSGTKLQSAVIDRLNHFESVFGTRARYEIVGVEKDLPMHFKNILLDIVQEALNNSGKHAQAALVEVRMEFKPEKAIVEITDNGIGFMLESALKKSKSPDHLGLTEMKKQVRAIGGILYIDTFPGCGTRIRISMPYPN